MLVCVLAWDLWLSAVKGVVGRGREAGGSGWKAVASWWWLPVPVGDELASRWGTWLCSFCHHTWGQYIDKYTYLLILTL